MTRVSLAYHAHDVRFSYRRRPGPEVPWAVHGVSFDVREGEVLGIVGPNGSGKTSLLKLLGKVLLPQRGTIELFGRDLHAMAQRDVARQVAFVPQEHQQVFPFTILETVLMGRFPHGERRFGLASAADLEAARSAMRDVDIEGLAERSIQDVSSGERQRAVIARALAQEPRVLLLDEPTSFLDLSHQIDICRILRTLNEERGLTVVLISHDLTLASQYCDRLLLMDRGQAVRLGTPEEVVRPDVLESVFHCTVLVDRHPDSGLPRVTLPTRRTPGAVPVRQLRDGLVPVRSVHSLGTKKREC